MVSFISILATIFFWFLATNLGWIKPLFLPSPQEIVETVIELVEVGYRQVPLQMHILVSLARALFAFAMAGIIGIPIGLLMGFFPVINAILDPFVQFFRPLPKLALIPLVILWFGIGETSKFVLIFMATLLTVIVSAAAAVKGVPENRMRVAKALGVNQYQFFRYVIFPSVLPDLFTGMRVGVGIGWTTLIAAEMIAATSGIGWMVLNASAYLRTDVVLLGIGILGTTGYLLDIAIVMVQKKVVPWMGKG
ncbi:MAG: ABC transporter permease subunit [Deltaproteobacteria bacterium]|nr:ABC transporter permease subunit [Deltaproteobacteria bacterium]MBW2308661.1 ABC transporter permease subunit [Deltaproteobacteria bacterium]